MGYERLTRLALLTIHHDVDIYGEMILNHIAKEILGDVARLIKYMCIDF